MYVSKNGQNCPAYQFGFRRQNRMDLVIITKAPVTLADNLPLHNAHTSVKLGRKVFW